MDTVLLEYFMETARTEHMSKAAENLNISQSSLSENIKKLETQLGVRLFDRVGRSISLNAAGRLLACEGPEILLRIKTVTESLRAIEQERRSTVNIVSPSLYSFPGLVERMENAFPSIVINNMPCQGSELASWLLSGRIDMVVTNKKIDSPGLYYEVLRDEELFVLLPTGHRLAGRNGINVAELKTEKFVCRSCMGSMGLDLKALFEPYGIVPQIGFISDNLKDHVDAVRNGRYITVGPMAAFYTYSLEGISPMRITDGDITCELVLYMSKDRPLSQAAETVKKVILKYFTENKS